MRSHFSGCVIVVVVTLAAAGFAAVPVLFGAFATYLGAEILILILFALAFNLMLGHGGLVSFGHAAYFAVAGYALAILLTTYSWPFWPAFMAAIALSSVAALVIGYFYVKLTEIYFAMLTQAFSQLVWAIAFKWDDVTVGDEGFIGVSVPGWLTEPANFYYVALAVTRACGTALWIITHSAFGRVLRATKENAQRAEFLGVDVHQVRLASFVLSGTFTGVAGRFYPLQSLRLCRKRLVDEIS